MIQRRCEIIPLESYISRMLYVLVFGVVFVFVTFLVSGAKSVISVYVMPLLQPDCNVVSGTVINP